MYLIDRAGLVTQSIDLDGEVQTRTYEHANLRLNRLRIASSSGVTTDTPAARRPEWVDRWIRGGCPLDGSINLDWLAMQWLLYGTTSLHRSLIPPYLIPIPALTRSQSGSVAGMVVAGAWVPFRLRLLLHLALLVLLLISHMAAGGSSASRRLVSAFKPSPGKF